MADTSFPLERSCSGPRTQLPLQGKLDHPKSKTNALLRRFGAMLEKLSMSDDDALLTESE
jgi:hypothetical protein